MYKIIHSQLFFRIILSILAIRLSTTLHIRGESSRECNYFKNNSESIQRLASPIPISPVGEKIESRIESFIFLRNSISAKRRENCVCLLFRPRTQNGREQKERSGGRRESDRAIWPHNISPHISPHHFNYFASFHAIVPAIGVHREKCFLLGRAAR